jgi:hypothetical protein
MLSFNHLARAFLLATFFSFVIPPAYFHLYNQTDQQRKKKEGKT